MGFKLIRLLTWKLNNSAKVICSCFTQSITFLVSLFSNNIDILHKNKYANNPNKNLESAYLRQFGNF